MVSESACSWLQLPFPSRLIHFLYIIVLRIGFWENGRVGSAKSVSQLNNNCSGRSAWCNNDFGILEAVEGLQLPGEHLDRKVAPISALRKTAATHSCTLSNVAGSCTCIPRAAYMQLTRATVAKKDPILQVPRSALIIVAASDHRDADKEVGSYCHTSSYSCKPLPNWSDSQGI